MNQHYPYRCTLMTTIEETPWTDPVQETPFFNIYRDKYAVTEGHTLYVPIKDEWYYINKCLEAAYDQGSRWVENGYCDAYNIGQNVGRAAGQTIMYPHIHLIPRRKGDMNDPRGGVRHVIPEKGNYTK